MTGFPSGPGLVLLPFTRVTATDPSALELFGLLCRHVCPLLCSDSQSLTISSCPHNAVQASPTLIAIRTPQPCRIQVKEPVEH